MVPYPVQWRFNVDEKYSTYYYQLYVLCSYRAKVNHLITRFSLIMSSYQANRFNVHSHENLGHNFQSLQHKRAKMWNWSIFYISTFENSVPHMMYMKNMNCNLHHSPCLLKKYQKNPIIHVQCSKNQKFNFHLPPPALRKKVQLNDGSNNILKHHPEKSHSMCTSLEKWKI